MYFLQDVKFHWDGIHQYDFITSSGTVGEQTCEVQKILKGDKYQMG